MPSPIALILDLDAQRREALRIILSYMEYQPVVVSDGAR